MSHVHHKDVVVKAAVITVSTSRTEKTDLSGKIIQECFESASIPVVSRVVVADAALDICRAVEEAVSAALVSFSGSPDIANNIISAFS